MTSFSYREKMPEGRTRGCSTLNTNTGSQSEVSPFPSIDFSLRSPLTPTPLPMGEGLQQRTVCLA